ncbi:MAG: GGDEF domain-containing protein [Anaerovoracaceae bacterium]
MNSTELMAISLKKGWKEYKIFLLLIASLEIFMMIYGMLLFDFHDVRRILYFASYIFLFCITVLTFFSTQYLIKNEKQMYLIARSTYIYSFILIFWSAFISALDIRGGGYPVTYMTILAAIGSILVVRPVFYVIMAAASSIFMIAASGDLLHVSWFFSFLLNLVIFLVVMIAVQIRNYNSVRQQYLLNQKLETWAGIDSLTQISNRRSLNSYIEDLQNGKQVYTVALLDADNFKPINDTYGHQEGDQCLIEIADALRQTFGRTVFRYGGDEFAVISFESPNEVAKKIDGINQILKTGRTSFLLQISCGIVQNNGCLNEQQIFEYADDALYQAKNHGKACAVIYEKERNHSKL